MQNVTLNSSGLPFNICQIIFLLFANFIIEYCFMKTQLGVVGMGKFILKEMHTKKRILPIP